MKRTDTLLHIKIGGKELQQLLLFTSISVINFLALGAWIDATVKPV
jgi:hypothetical protein